MMKPGLLSLALAVLPALGAFGMDFSLGAGGLLGGLFTRYTLRADGELVVPVQVFSEQELDQINFGGFLFFDATWAELSLGLQGGRGAYWEAISAKSGGQEVYGQRGGGTGRETMLDLSLLGKYPFRLNERLSIFPLAGLSYQIALRQYRDPDLGAEYDRTDGIREKDRKGNAYTLSAWNSLFINIGAGLDITLYRRLFLRTEVLYGFRLKTPFEIDALDRVKDTLKAPDPKLKGLTGGPSLRLSLGWRL
ncbi:MAG: hypothetical protein LBQ46_03275 [Treponema sp.]|nr:hypothetical protein [Treponema sp.]